MRDKIILTTLIFITHFLVAQTKLENNRMYFKDCDVSIFSDRKYNKYVYNLITVEKKKKNQLHLQEKYCCFSIANDYTYPMLTNQDPNVICFLGFIITEKSVILDFLLPYFSNDSIKEKILYTYSNNRDTIFKDLIEYEKKIVVNDEVYYYPLKDTTLSYAVITNLYLHTFDDFLELLRNKKLLREDCLINKHFICKLSVHIPLLKKGKDED